MRPETHSDTAESPTLLQFKVFATVARCESITQAAEDLRYLNPSSVVYHIRSLEQFYGVELFVHGKKRMQLTECGRLLYSAVQEVFTRLDDVARAVAAQREVAGKLALGGSAPVLSLLRSAYNFLRAETPSLEIRVTHFWESKDVERALLRGEIDVGILLDVSSEGLEQLELVVLRETIVVAIAAESLVGDRRFITKEELSQQNLLAPKANPDARGVHAKIVKDLGIKFRSVEEVSSLPVIKEKVLAGCGVALIPGTTARDHFDGKWARLLRVRDADPRRHVFLAWLRDKAGSPYRGRLSSILQELLDE